MDMIFDKRSIRSAFIRVHLRFCPYIENDTLVFIEYCRFGNISALKLYI